MPVLNTIAFTTATTGCVSGGDRINCTVDGGRSWSTRYRHVTIVQLAFVTPSVGWAVAPSLLLATADGGRTWRQRAIVPGLQAVDFVNARDGWAITTHGLLVTHSGGVHWAPDRSPVSPRAMSFVDSQNGWVLGHNGAIVRTMDGGRSWRYEWTPPIGSTWDSGQAQLTFTNATTGWLLLTLGAGCTGKEPAILYHTDDSGQHWQAPLTGAECNGPRYPTGAVAGTGGYPYGLSARGRQAWVVSDSPAAGRGSIDVAVTHDDGRTWAYTYPATTDAGTATAAIDFVDARRGWVVTGGEFRYPSGRVFHTTDGGHTWTVQLT